MDLDFSKMETIITWVGTNIVAVIALLLSFRANRISQKAYILSSKPIIECYLATHKKEGNTALIVLVTENFGNLTARDIELDIDYPDGIDNSRFGNEARRLGKTKFTLAPSAKISIPICMNTEMETVVNGEIKISGKFTYFDIENKCKPEKMAQVTLTVDEFNLFNAINKAGGQQ